MQGVIKDKNFLSNLAGEVADHMVIEKKNSDDRKKTLSPHLPPVSMLTPPNLTLWIELNWNF
ncbi:hypothetical protein [Methanosphaerula palustris]|uniref:hypothetical protein n=1 Tax=Methanosphaerula palustris TaxID=475088 RepID=UPI00130508E4|nr:hypothetical protein [Methanosphaerula palustris]